MLKKKNLYVVVTSVLVVLLVIMSSFLGLIIYLQWRQLNMAYSYYDTLEELDTLSYAKNVEINSLKIKAGFNRVAMLEGRIINKGKRTVASLALRVKLLDSADNAVFSSVIYPLEPFQPPRMFEKLRLVYFAFLKGFSIEPNKSVAFKYPVWRLPRRYIKQLRKGSYSAQPGEWSGKISAEVARIKLKPA